MLRRAEFEVIEAARRRAEIIVDEAERRREALDASAAGLRRRCQQRLEELLAELDDPGLGVAEERPRREAAASVGTGAELAAVLPPPPPPPSAPLPSGPPPPPAVLASLPPPWPAEGALEPPPPGSRLIELEVTGASTPDDVADLERRLVELPGVTGVRIRRLDDRSVSFVIGADGDELDVAPLLEWGAELESAAPGRIVLRLP